MILSISLNYFFGIKIEKQTNISRKKRILFYGIALNLVILIIFKYTNFIIDNINPILVGIGLGGIKLKSIHLPIGISFFTFQSMSYIIDVYRGSGSVTSSFSNVALYISLFPQLIAGPIVRYSDIADQIVYRSINIEQFSSGVKRFIIGLAKKVLIANTIARIADDIFELAPGEHTFAVAWLGAIAYTLQIYFDFSGYSDMAIGLGKMFGFTFPENFNYPYISKSIKEFWRRWHISLSSWFRDYLYIPLGGNKLGLNRTYINLITVFFLTGLWHGASWTFVVWGLYHGFFLILERIGFNKLLGRCGALISTIYTLLIVVIGWVIFRAENFSYAWAYMQSMFGYHCPEKPKYYLDYFLDNEIILTILIGVILSTPVYLKLKLFRSYIINKIPNSLFQLTSNVVVHLVFVMLFILSAIYVSSNTYNPFIYFRF